jgi:hypothetical protein
MLGLLPTRHYIDGAEEVVVHYKRWRGCMYIVDMTCGYCGVSIGTGTRSCCLEGIDAQARSDMRAASGAALAARGIACGRTATEDRLRGGES